MSYLDSTSTNATETGKRLTLRQSDAGFARTAKPPIFSDGIIQLSSKRNLQSNAAVCPVSSAPRAGFRCVVERPLALRFHELPFPKLAAQRGVLQPVLLRGDNLGENGVVFHSPAEALVDERGFVHRAPAPSGDALVLTHRVSGICNTPLLVASLKHSPHRAEQPLRATYVLLLPPEAMGSTLS